MIRAPIYPSARQRGLTLVELLVAMALSGLIALAGIAALTLSQRGFTSVDASAQLRDNGRFATSIMRRIILQGGYLKDASAIDQNSDFKLTADLLMPDIQGFNNTKFKESLVIGTSETLASSGVNKSDMLVVRYQTGETNPGSETLDESMINCAGGKGEAAIESKDRMISVFYVATSPTTGEPTLMCTWQNNGIGNLTKNAQPLVGGVESLQILYGVDGITTPNTAFVAPAKTVPPANTDDTVPERYLRADQIGVTGNEAATLLNWSRVRTIRVGMVIRGPAGSAPEKNVPAQYPLGATGVMDSSGDEGSVFAQQSDQRLRQTFTFTVHLRNPRTGV